MVLTIGVLFLLDHSLHVAGFGKTWPVILLVVGAVKLLQGSASAAGHNPLLGSRVNPPGGPIPPVPPVPPASVVPPPGEVNRG
jgi:hypothetical protein